MLTKEQILAAVEAGRESKSFFDGRDYGRLVAFFDAADWEKFGFELKEGAAHTPKEFTESEVLEQLKSDVAFGFEKALDQRGLSAGAMNGVVLMWMWVLEDDLQHDEEYAQYGLPLLKKVAVKYGLDNPIGESYGNEAEFACD